MKFTERKIMSFSLGANALLALCGLYFGYTAHSSAILIDGMYSTLLTVMSFLSLGVIYLLKKPVSKSHPFGYASYEPLINLFRGLLIVMVILFGMSESIHSLSEGGNIPDFTASMYYFVLCMSGCVIAYIVVLIGSKKIPSPILKVETTNWLMDTLLTAGMGVSFLVASFLKDTYPEIISYVDPIITIILMLSILKMPYKTIKESVSELVLMEASEEITDRVHSILKRHESTDEVVTHQKSVTKTGREVYILLVILLNKKTKISIENQLFNSVEKQDHFRAELYKELKDISESLKLDVSFTYDKRWL
ncbi:cation diffusion facilitator family transporter [Flammeovirga kamogawensis]|uniref:Cation diffusion facilitator family transporter n=1 Tax=Flammeovirga kamogawensis TaxID=373891 RepID=A0ABX8H3U2_9BACT|nr:cation diffusion facilitator family transporter [Flammeovirga kamogawensis]MBB6460266.1 cation diffusion facilitator family transporter [Flammeovirga kamogawensis]QWG10077.1 cation diffusion facilitator family transporter [Flammeovirga kamogawensis]TRX65584.1 cation diffusion facilitator family transporter [Flammeovirga kamogawensis]